ncbi:dynamin family protein [Dactylosporangium aurantiacum]|uniref:Dynamin family protein n=1 Tax=Dactylosporangium aurantiacum TaxID=35754 RepID=A0A9Q9ICW7_9ACTN|nr:dynamin family protein [Dactylosporangium aurantiacum]MDG6106731.1 dynamin family protein [Dactylosporangium aurantiacum]UWZ50878.1 dynamin family protein [Dactylosporangium aurantiacum]
MPASEPSGLASIGAWLRDDPSLARLEALSQDVRDLALDAGLDPDRHPVLKDPTWTGRLRARAAAPVTVIVIGQVSAGKSTFVNSMLGRRLLPTSQDPTDGVVSVLQATEPGAPERAERVTADGRVEPFASLEDGVRFLARQSAGEREQLGSREVRLYLDEPILQNLRLVNTPGLGDRLAAFERVTLDWLRDDASDLVIWTFFPDSAANRGELGVFADALTRRRNAVLGVVTRAMEDHEDEPDFDPRTDAQLAGVVAQLRAQLGDYLHDVVLYDAYRTRTLLRQLQADPGRATDPRFAVDLERCGYTAVRDILTRLAGDVDARRMLLMRQCAGTAGTLADAADAAEQIFTARARIRADQLAAFQRVEHEVINPVHDLLDTDLTTIADRFAAELVHLHTEAASDVIAAEFTLGGSLVGSAAAALSRVTARGAQVDTVSQRLSRAIEAEMERKLAATSFQERLLVTTRSTVQRRLSALAAELRIAAGDRGPGGRTAVTVDVRPVGGMAQPLVEGIVSHVVGTVAEAAAKSLVGGTSAAIGRSAIEQAGTAVAVGAARTATTSTLAKAVGVFTVVMVPLDVRRLFRDFNEGKARLIQGIAATYERSRWLYAGRIRDTLVPIADDAVDDLRSAARASLVPAESGDHRSVERAAAAGNAAIALRHIKETLTHAAAGHAGPYGR